IPTSTLPPTEESHNSLQTNGKLNCSQDTDLRNTAITLPREFRRILPPMYANRRHLRNFYPAHYYVRCLDHMLHSISRVNTCQQVQYIPVLFLTIWTVVYPS